MVFMHISGFQSDENDETQLGLVTAPMAIVCDSLLALYTSWQCEQLSYLHILYYSGVSE